MKENTENTEKTEAAEETELAEERKTGQKRRKKLSGRKKLAIALAAFVLFVGGVLGGLQLGVVWADKTWVHWRPDYEKTDITAVLDKEELTDEDYELLYRQTGLTKLGIDGLLEAGKKSQILKIQEFYFEEHSVSCERFNPFTYSEKLDDIIPLAELEDGDIVVTATTHVSGWRLGHAALVVDGSQKKLAEAFGPGDLSELTYISSFTDLADIMILRPKFSQEFRSEVAAYAQENLIGVPYSFATGILSPKYREGKFTDTQCAHLVWYAYKHFGVDLDSNGGLVVTPPEIANSPYVEVVQIYGFDPVKLWK